MRNFFKKRKALKIGIIVFLVILLVAFIYFFVFPLFNTNKYGDRLDGIEEHEIASTVIDSISEDMKANEFVSDVNYHDEGRILNFIVTVNAGTAVADAQKLADVIMDKIEEDDQSYYDIQIMIKTSEEDENYPIIGYKSKQADSFDFGNVGGSSE